MSDAKGLTRQQMCDRLAMEFQDGWVVNLGIGIPTLCSNFDFGDKEIIFHSENGVIGYGPLTGAGKEDLHLVNAGGQHVTLNPGAAIVHHADSFGMIRSGRIDVTVLGAYEVAENGDFANWKMAGQKGGGIGGAMDRQKCLYGFDLDNDPISNEHVDAIALIEAQTSVTDWYRYLSTNRDSLLFQLVCEASLVNALQQARTERRVDLQS